MALLKTAEVADKLRINIHHFRKVIKHSPDFPKPIKYKASSHPKWEEEDINEYIKTKKH